MAAESGDATDEMLMVRYQRGDRQAFAELVRRHSRPMYNFVLRQLRDGTVAEDVTQEVFLRVVQSAAEFKHEARFSTWLYTIARNHCVDQLRRLAHRRHASLDGPIAGSETRTLGELLPELHPRASAERGVAGAQVLNTILRAVDALPDDQREVFLMRELANLPFREIAAITASPENTVKSRMRYALERLREALADFEEYARALR
ncbi:MAG TPA: RNA polymerase sigma factor [Polyangiaceae bacterium]